MARVSFTPHLVKHLDAPPQRVSAATLGEALEAVFRDNPRLRGYVFDDQNCIRQHVAIFINDRLVTARNDLSLSIDAESEIYVMQALSGG